MKTNPTYFVGEESRRYLDALNVFQEFKNALLYALTENYGEQRVWICTYPTTKNMRG